MHFLQSRWVMRENALVYYGLRNGKNMFRNRVGLSARQAEIIRSLPKELDAGEKRAIKKLLGVQVVESGQVRAVPDSIDSARFCTGCGANDYIIPGLEFDENGLCPMCASEEKTRGFVSVVPVVEDIPRARRSRFDCALFYTGGKDSTYLLYYLAKVKGLRVLALTWEIPYMSESALQSIENAKLRFDNVEFISRRMSGETLRRVYKRLYELSENTCACPSLAYVLFYPELVANRVPYFLAGNEPAQVRGLYYNHMAPPAAYRFARSAALQGMANIGRIVSLRPPLSRGQFHTLSLLRRLVNGETAAEKLTGYRNELVSNITEAIHTVPELLPPLCRALRYSSRTGHIPAFVHVDLDKACGGSYDWRRVKDIIIKECGWVAPDGDKGLHTSCKIEKCKEYSQYKRFRECRSTMIPFSAIEISLAGRGKSLSREQAVAEMKEHLGFSLEEPPECALMRDYINGCEACAGALDGGGEAQ